MTAFSIIRIAKLKSWGAVGGAAAHNARTRETPNADPASLHRNRFLIGSPDEDPVAVCQARLGDQKIRKNAVYAVDGFLGASPEYFRPGNPGQAGAFDQVRLDAWVEANIIWLKERFGDRIINAVLHLDETTAHIQFLLLPLDDSGKLSYRTFFGGRKYVLSQLQTDYAEAMSILGLTRGREGSQAKHQEVAEYYAVTQNVEHTPPPKLPAVDNITLPEPPGAMARMKTDNLIEYGRDCADQVLAAVSPITDAIIKRSDKLAAENLRLNSENESLKEANAKLNRQKAAFKAEADRMRELPLNQVLAEMFGAVETADSKPHHKRRTFMLPDGAAATFSGQQWELGKSKGRGAINLVMALSGYDQNMYRQAVRDMAEVFGERETLPALAVHLAESAPRELPGIIKEPIQTPKPFEYSWPKVREFLIERMKLPSVLVDQMHDDGLIFSDRRYNCVFRRDGDSGLFKIGTGDRPFSQSLGKDGNPFVIPGSDNKVYITDSPLEAISLKLMRPDSAVLATGGFMQADKLKPYLDQKETILALGQTEIGKEMALYLSEHLPKAKQIQPNQGRSWNECRLLQIEEDKAKRAEAAIKAQSNMLTPTANISRSTGWSR